MDKTGYRRTDFKQQPPSLYSRFRHSPENDPRSTEELIRLILVELDEDARWRMVGILQRRISPDVFAAVEKLAVSVLAEERELAADILGQSGLRDKWHHNAFVLLLLRMLEKEQDPSVLNSIAVALGHRGDPRSIGPLLPFRMHPDADVRYGVVHGLSGSEDERAINALIELSADEDSDVRDWATFGLGSQIDINNQVIRDALWARIEDEDEDTRLEAISGLAPRGDTRVVGPLLQEFELEWPNVVHMVFEAMIEAGTHMYDQRLYPALLKLWTSDDEYWRDDLAEAIDRQAKYVTKQAGKKS